MFKWGVKGSIPNKEVFEKTVEDVAVITTKKWSKLHEGHADVSTMLH